MFACGGDMMKKRVATAGLVFVLATGAAYAQQQDGLVNVAVSDVNLLNDLKLTAPVTVQVPVDVAANVCGVDVNVLSKQVKTNPTCSCEAKQNAQA